jgi:hypothetical protein
MSDFPYARGVNSVPTTTATDAVNEMSHLRLALKKRLVSP